MFVLGVLICSKLSSFSINAALWTNDQCEYVNPLFGYLGYDIGEQESINSYELYRQYVAEDKAIITSIVAEGDDIWHGAISNVNFCSGTSTNGNISFRNNC